MGIVGVVDLAFVGEEHVAEDAVAEQELPGGVVPRPTGDIDGEDDAHAVLDHVLGELAVSQPAAGGAGGFTLVLIEQEDPLGGPPQFLGTFAEGALPQRAFGVVADLFAAALADVDDGKALEMAGLDEFVHGVLT